MDSCKSCKKPIRWAQTEKGHRVPLDPEPVDGGNIVIVQPSGIALYVPPEAGKARFVSHFATCPNAAAHRKAKK